MARKCSTPFDKGILKALFEDGFEAENEKYSYCL